MNNKQWRRALWGCAASWLLAAAAQASVIRLEPTAATVAQGTAFDVRIVADIDQAEEIIGFGFDLNASPGVRLLGFTPGAGFVDDPIYLAPFSDSDGIRAASGGSLLFGPSIWGTGIVLGTLRLDASILGLALIGLGADDLSFNYTEGLIALSPGIGNFMPQVEATIEVTPAATGVPEPTTLASAALALAAFAGVRLRRRSTAVKPG